jgi:hypothetical protein
MAISNADVVALIEDIKREFPAFKIVEKRGWFWNALHWAVYVLTFGGNKSFRDSYITTVGPIIAVPVGWDAKASAYTKWATLSHERVHLRQTRKLGLGLFWAGILPFWVLYLLLPLPIGLAYFRYLFEREAYFENVLCDDRVFGKAVAYKRIERCVEQLTTGAYGYTWPFKHTVRKYFTRRYEQVLNARSEKSKTTGAG